MLAAVVSRDAGSIPHISLLTRPVVTPWRAQEIRLVVS